MSRRTQENIVVGLLVFFLIGYIVLTLDFGPNARLVPLPIAILGLLLVLVQLLLQNLGDGRELHIDLFESLTSTIAQSEPAPESEAIATSEGNETAGAHADEGRRELWAFGFVAAFIGLIVLLGPVSAVFLFSVGYFLFSRHYPPWRAIAVGAGFTVGVYLLFVVGLQLQLYHGILEPLFAGY
jgi:hypothetical protein